MKTLDTEKAIRFITKFEQYIDSVSAGLIEDWFWTAATVFDKDTKVEDISFDSVWTSSNWATPVLIVTLRTGKEITINCYNEEGESSERPAFFSLGVLSEPIQDNLEGEIIYDWDETNDDSLKDITYIEIKQIEQ